MVSCFYHLPVPLDDVAYLQPVISSSLRKTPVHQASAGENGVIFAPRDYRKCLGNGTMLPVTEHGDDSKYSI